VLIDTVEPGLEQKVVLSDTPTLPEVVCLLSEIASIAKVSYPVEQGEEPDNSRPTRESLVAPLSRVARPVGRNGDSRVAPESLIASLPRAAAPVGGDENLDDGSTPEEGGEGRKVVDIELGKGQQETLRSALPLEEMEVGDSREVPAVLTKESAFRVVFRFGNEKEDALLTTREACKLLRVSKSFLYRKIRAGELAYLRVGRSLRFRKKELMKLVDGKVGEPAADASAESA